MFFPRRRDVDLPRAMYTVDSVLTAIYVMVFVWFLWWVPQTPFGSHLGRAEAVLLGFIVPQIVWNFMAGFVTYQHHTHPQVAGFTKKDEWDYLTAQVEETTHVRFPRPVNFVLHYIMEHTAHHAQTSIPLYQLNAAQKKLEEHFRDRMVIVDWTFSSYLDAVRRCKLYDYENHYWLDFKGRRTSACTLQTSGEFSNASLSGR